MKESCFNFSILIQRLPTGHVTAGVYFVAIKNARQSPTICLLWLEKGELYSSRTMVYHSCLTYLDFFDFMLKKILQTFKDFSFPLPCGGLLNNPGKHISCDLVRS